MTVRDQIPDSTIIAAYWWSDSRADVACKLHTSADHVKRVRAKAKWQGIIPDLPRPAQGFDPRVTALGLAKHFFPQTAFTVPCDYELGLCKSPYDLPAFAHGKDRSQHGGSSA